MNTRSAAARDADEFFDFARYGLMLAEQIGDDVTRDNLLKLIRLVGGLTGCQAVNGRAGLMRELIYISLLAGFASGLAAALDRPEGQAPRARIMSCHVNKTRRGSRVRGDPASIDRAAGQRIRQVALLGREAERFALCRSRLRRIDR
jgi:hypothetical protein